MENGETPPTRHRATDGRTDGRTRKNTLLSVQYNITVYLQRSTRPYPHVTKRAPRKTPPRTRNRNAATRPRVSRPPWRRARPAALHPSPPRARSRPSSWKDVGSMDVRRSVSWTSRAGRTTSKGTRGRRERKKEKKTHRRGNARCTPFFPFTTCVTDMSPTSELRGKEGTAVGFFQGVGGRCGGAVGGNKQNHSKKKSRTEPHAIQIDHAEARDSAHPAQHIAQREVLRDVQALVERHREIVRSRHRARGVLTRFDASGRGKDARQSRGRVIGR